MTRRDAPDPGSWPFNDDPEGDRADRQATLALALALDRTRQRRRKLAARWREKRTARKD